MVTIYVRGERIGPISDVATLTRLIEAGESFEVRNDSDRTLGRFRADMPTAPLDPPVPWDPTLTREDLDRMSSEGGIPFEEVKTRLGWV